MLSFNSIARECIILLCAIILVHIVSSAETHSSHLINFLNLRQQDYKTIQCICSDVDGTLTRGPLHACDVPDDVISSIKATIASGIKFYPCTGRTRSSMNSVTKGKIADIFGGLDRTPGVYQQGLMVFGQDGNLLWERFLPNETVKMVADFCDNHKIPLLAYCGENIYRQAQCSETDKIVTYDDPMPITFPQGLDKLVESGIKVHKMILMSDDSVLGDIRGQLTDELNGVGTLTQAVPGLLEVLPYGSSKGDGVARLLKEVRMTTKHACAFGDGENDIEMFQLVKYSVAVSNAKPKLKQIAKYITDSNENSGVAKALLKIAESKQHFVHHSSHS